MPGKELQRTFLRILRPMASHNLTVKDLFSSELLAQLSTVRVNSDRGILGLQTVDPSDGDLVGLPALTTTSQEWFFPIPTTGEPVELWTAVGLFNPSKNSASITIEAFDAINRSLGNIDDATILPGANNFVITANIEGSIPPDAAVLKVITDQAVIGYEVIGVKGGMGVTATLGISAEDRITAGFELTGSANGGALAVSRVLRLPDGSLKSTIRAAGTGEWSKTWLKDLSRPDEVGGKITSRNLAAAHQAQGLAASVGLVQDSQTIKKVAVTDDPTGTELGGFFLVPRPVSFLGGKFLNQSRQVLFKSGVVRSPVVGSTDGLFRSDPATGGFKHTRVMAINEPTPVGGNFLRLWAGQLNDQGIVTFAAQTNLLRPEDGPCKGTAGIALMGIFSWSGGAAKKVVFEGDVVPGTQGTRFYCDTGSNSFLPFSFPDFDMNNSGQILFEAAVVDKDGIFKETGIYQAGGGKVVANGDPGPFGVFSGISNIRLNDAGQVLFNARSGNTSGLFLALNRKVAASGDIVPGVGTLVAAPLGILNNFGEVAFTVFVNDFRTQGVFFADANGTIVKVALTGDSAPGGGTFNFGQFTVPIKMNKAGEIVFSAVVGSSQFSDIFKAVREPSGKFSIKKVVAVGDGSPEVGGLFNFGALDINDLSDVAFAANSSLKSGVFLALGDSRPGGPRVEWVGESRNDGKTNLEVGGHPAEFGGGDRIFPDRNHPSGTAGKDDLHDRVRIRMTLPEAPAEGKSVTVHFKVFDPDHYSDDPEFDTANGPGDDPCARSQGHVCDNVKAGRFHPRPEFDTAAKLMKADFSVEATSATLVGDGTTRTVDLGLQITNPQPGNNWIVAADVDQAAVNAIVLGAAGKTLKVNGTPGAADWPKEKQTPLLTTWRRLYVEIDRMAEPGLNAGPGQSKFDGGPAVKRGPDKVQLTLGRGNEIVAGQLNQFQGGKIELLRADGTSLGVFDVTGNTVGPRPLVTVKIEGAEPVPEETARFKDLNDDDINNSSQFKVSTSADMAPDTSFWASRLKPALVIPVFDQSEVMKQIALRSHLRYMSSVPDFKRIASIHEIGHEFGMSDAGSFLFGSLMSVPNIISANTPQKVDALQWNGDALKLIMTTLQPGHNPHPKQH